MVRNSKGEIAKKILLSLVAIGAVGACIMLPGMAIVLSLFVPKNQRERQSYYRSLYGLQRKNYISLKKKGSSYEIRVTKEGEKLLGRYKFAQLKLRKPKRWDGFWRAVTFDIPETKKGVRIALNRKLKELGFLAFQKSLFIYPYDCKEEINFIRDYFNEHDTIKYFIVKNFEGSKKIAKYFKLIK